MEGEETNDYVPTDPLWEHQAMSPEAGKQEEDGFEGTEKDIEETLEGITKENEVTFEDGLEGEESISILQESGEMHPKEPWIDQMKNSRLLQSTRSLSIPEVSNFMETERIRRCFLPGNCLGSLKKLPETIKPGAMVKNKTEMIFESRRRKARGTGVGKNILRDGYFSNLEYRYSDYDALDQMIRNDKEKKKLMVDSFGRKPFTVSNGRIHKRYEDMIMDCKDVLVDGGPPTQKVTLENGGMLRSNDPRPSDPNLMNRPSFHPPALKIDLSHDIGRDRIQYWMNEIFSELSKSWPNMKFKVNFTLQDELLVSFEIGENVNIAHLGGLLLKYMNTLARNGLGSKFQLKRRGDRWNVYETQQQEDGTIIGHIVFAFDAPWVNTGILKVKKAAAAQERENAKQARKKKLMRKAQGML